MNGCMTCEVWAGRIITIMLNKWNRRNAKDDILEKSLVLDPKGIEITAQNDYKSIAMNSTECDDISLNGYKNEEVNSATGGYIAAIPSELVRTSTINVGKYTAESTLSIKHHTTNVPEKFVELTTNSVFSKNEQES